MINTFLFVAKHHDIASLRFIYRFKIAHVVPLEHDISYEKIARIIGLDEDRTRRVLQYAMINGIFKQSKPGHVAHTALSAAITNDEFLEAMIGHFLEEAYPSACALTDVLAKYPINTGSPHETGFQEHFHTDLSTFQYFEIHPERLKRFGKAMSSFSLSGGPFGSEHVLRAFDWASLGDATVVDVSTRICSSTVDGIFCHQSSLLIKTVVLTSITC